MKLSRFVYRKVGFSGLLLAALVGSAIGEPGKCSNRCTPTCGSPDAPCRVVISHTAHRATPTIQNFASKPNADICVAMGTEISWSTLESPSQFTATFGTSHPFAGTPQGTPAIFTGNNGQTASDKTIAEGCYRYSIRHCITTSCKKNDPKVIVTNVFLHK